MMAAGAMSGTDPIDHARAWRTRRSYAHADYDEARLRAERVGTVSVCVPAREEAGTIRPIVECLAGLRDRGVIDEVVVIDAGSEDGTGAIAAAAGATVHGEADLLPDRGPVLGKGDAMWRALSVLTGDIVCFVDADTEAFGDQFVRGLIGPLVCEPGLSFVKGTYRRPFRAGETRLPEGGGRVNDLTARPLLARFFPELAGVRQPLAGEFAARRALLERLPFSTGYGIEIGLLIDAYLEVGLDGLAQSDLGVRQNAHQGLDALGPMAAAILTTVTRRLERAGRLTGPSSDAFLDAAGAVRDAGVAERPPYSGTGSRRSPGASGTSADSSRDPSSTARTAT
jgi:glucosyl-3-phosphoglycerate synthase